MGKVLPFRRKNTSADTLGSQPTSSAAFEKNASWTFEEIQVKNRNNAERLRKERQEKNHKVKLDYRLLK